MARDRIGARKAGGVNPDIDTRLNGGDEHSLAAAIASGGPGIVNSISITAGSLVYTQNFDTLATSGTALSFSLANWAISETGGNTTYAAGTGASTAGDTYSFGIAGTNPATDRALGSICTNTITQIFYGAGFTNSTGLTLGSLLISYVGEQWRNNGNASAQSLTFQISYDATTLTNGSWTTVSALNFTSPIHTASSVQLDGNAAANRVSISSTISDIHIAANATFWIRWMDVNDSGNDHSLAVDDFSLTATTLPAEPTVDLNGPGAGTGFSSTFTEDVGGGGAGARIGAANMTILDDSNTLDHVTLTITNGRAGDRVYIESDDGPGWMQLGQASSYVWTLTSSFGGPHTVAEWAAAVSHLRYFNDGQDPDSNGNRPTVTIAVVANDGTNNSAAATASITVVPHNDEATFANYVIGNVTEDTQPTDGGKLDVFDVDGPDTVVAMSNFVSTYGVFSIDTAGNWTYTLDSDNPAIAALDDGDIVVDTITVHATDGTPFDIQIAINGHRDPPSNPAPTVDLNGADDGTTFAVNYTEGDPVGVLISGPGVLISDDQDLLSVVRLVITDGRAGDNLYHVSGDLPGGLFLEWNDQTFTLEITASHGPVSGATMAAALATIGFRSDDPDPDIGGAYGSRLVQVRASDGENFGDPAYTSISIDPAPPAHNPPVVDAGIGDVHTAEDMTVSYTFDANAFSDPDGDTLTYTAYLFDGVETMLPRWLSFDGASRTFSGTPPQDFNGTLSIRVYASDGTGSVSTDFDLVIDPVNDAPVNTVPVGPITVTEDVGQAIMGLAVADVDIDFGEITVTLGVLHGTLWVRDDVAFGIGALDITDNGSATVILHCHPDDINATLAAVNGVVYRPDADYVGGDTLTMTSIDGGATGTDPGGNPGSEQDIDTATIAIAGVNDAPVITAPASVTVTEDTPFDVTSLSAADPDAAHFTVTLQVGHGTLFVTGYGGLSGGRIIVFSADATVTADILANLGYTPDANYNGADALTITVNDEGNSGSGGAQSDTEIVNITVNPVADAPAGTDATLTTPEDTPYTFSAADFGFSDPLDGNGLFEEVIITTLPTAGTLTLNGGAVAAGQHVAAADIPLLVFTPTPDHNGDGYASFTFQVVDDGGTADGGVDTDQSPNTITFDVTPVNDAPVNSVPGATQSVNEDGGLTFSSGNANLITVSDLDSGTEDITVTLTVLHGTLTVGGNAGLTDLTGDGTATVSFIGTVAEVNNALNGLVYAPAANYYGPDTLQIVTSDNGNTGTGGTLADSDCVAITIASINDAPAGTNATLTLNEDDTYTFSAADFGFSDPADPNVFLSVFVTTLPTNGILRLAGIPVVAGQEIPVGQVGSLVFTPAANANGNGYASFTFQVRDDGGSASGGQDTDQSPNTITFDVTAVNDRPTVNGIGGGTALFLEEGGPVPLDAPPTAATVTDIDSPDFGGGSLTVAITANGVPAEDLLSIAFAGLLGGDSGIVTYNSVQFASYTGGGAGGGALVFSFDSDASEAAVQALVRAIQYDNSNMVNPTTAPRTVTWTLVDGDGTANGGADTRILTSFVAVGAVNDAPSGTDATLTLDEDGSRTLTGADFGFSDVDGNNFAGLFVATLPGAGTLFIDTDGPGGSPPTAVTAGQLILKSQLDAGQLVFVPAPNGNGIGYASFTFQVFDNGGTSNGGHDTDQSPNTITFDVTAVNDAPVDIVPDAQTVNEDQALTFWSVDGNTISVADVDAGGGTITTTLDIASGALFPAPTGPGGPSVTGAGTNHIVISGTVAQVNSALGLLIYQPAANANGAFTLTITTTDHGNGGTGGALIDTDTVTINVTSVNDAPAGTDTMLTGSEDDPVVFTAADFGFSDVNDSPANGLLAVRIAGLPTAGTLFLDGDGAGVNPPVAVTAGQSISLAAIDAGHLYFLGASDGYGSPYASFTFQVQDNGGTANGGVDLDQSANLMTISLTPDNLPPVLDLNGPGPGVDYSASFVEDSAGVAIGSGIIVSDPDAGLGDLIESATVTLTDRVAGDALSVLGALPGGIGVNIVVNAGTLVVTLSGTASQADYATAIGQIRYVTTNQDPTVGGSDPSRTIRVTVNDGTIDGAVATTTINIFPVDDAPVAQPDAFTITESQLVTGASLFANNGSGLDSDADGPALAISAVNGAAGNVGNQIALASGALLKVNANGTFDYDPNGAFLSTPTLGSGASNTPGHDSFTYTLAGGNTVTVAITLTGLDTDDILRGTAGDDVLAGGIGNDAYFVENPNDQVIEANGAGSDRVFASVSYRLSAGQSVEMLTTDFNAGTTAINLTGNDLANVIFGNDGANLLDGRGGADTMVGRAGDDFFFVDRAADAVVEFGGEGNDRVFTSVSYTLAAGASVEILSTDWNPGTDAINLTGNAMANNIFGNDGANALDGRGGADILVGRAGDDFYFVDTAADTVIEGAGQGTDRIFASASYALAAGQNVEILSTDFNLGTAAINLTGNELANALVGNNGNNVLDGGAGSDVLIGGSGVDSFVFSTALGAGNVDTVADFAHGADRIALDDAVFTQLGGPGALDPSAFVLGSAAADVSDRIIYDGATGRLYYDADGTGAGAAIQFATLQPGTAVAAADLVVI